MVAVFRVPLVACVSRFHGSLLCFLKISLPLATSNIRASAISDIRALVISDIRALAIYDIRALAYPTYGP